MTYMMFILIERDRQSYSYVESLLYPEQPTRDSVRTSAILSPNVNNRDVGYQLAHT